MLEEIRGAYFQKTTLKKNIIRIVITKKMNLNKMNMESNKLFNIGKFEGFGK